MDWNKCTSENNVSMDRRDRFYSFLLDDLEPRKRRSFNDRVHKLISALTCAHREELHKKTKAKNSEHSTFFSKGVFSDRSGLLRENLLQRNMLYVWRNKNGRGVQRTCSVICSSVEDFVTLTCSCSCMVCPACLGPP